MELYYKDLISKDASLEQLVDNLTLMVQGADELAQATGSGVPEEHKVEIATRLARLKHRCNQIKKQAISSALATDKLIRQYPYSFAGFAFAAGLLITYLANRNSKE
jgi:ElaB/YqjD/DUF883 family membrane-anchored ribosome-binding protein